MARLILESEDQESLQLIEALARKMSVKVETEQNQKTDAENGQKASDQAGDIKALIETWHRQGGLETPIEDPVAWQRAIRKDRPLPFRDV
jgi:ABC-type nitrate/sulfonate/bicarbonate transport system substrate-binding protein